METADLTPLLEDLDEEVDELEDVLEPLFKQVLSKTTQRMPVLDKAKLHIAVTYTLESLIFSYLRLHGMNAKEHSVFKELTRVKQYFEKIEALEKPPEPRKINLDKEAATRFIKHGLVGNDKYDLERAEREAKEKAMAQLRATMIARKIESADNSFKTLEEEKVKRQPQKQGQQVDCGEGEPEEDDGYLEANEFDGSNPSTMPSRTQPIPTWPPSEINSRSGSHELVKNPKNSTHNKKRKEKRRQKKLDLQQEMAHGKATTKYSKAPVG